LKSILRNAKNFYQLAEDMSMQRDTFDVHKHDMEEGIRVTKSGAQQLESQPRLTLRKLAGKVYRHIQAKRLHPRIFQLERERDDALRMFELGRQREWRAVSVLASLNDLQSRNIGGAIPQEEFLSVWCAAWKKTPRTPPLVTLKQLEGECALMDSQRDS
jgi:hypothetical protein